MKESIQNCHLSRMLTKIKKAKKSENLGGEIIIFFSVKAYL